MIAQTSAVRRSTLFAATLLAGLAGRATAQEASPPPGAGPIVIGTPWSRATPGNAPVAAGYLTISNSGKEADRLVGGSSDISARLEVHEMSMANGVMTMRHLPGGLALPSGSRVELKPGGFHLMFQGLKHGLKEGEHFKATLQFEKAGPVSVDFTVGSLAATKAPDPGSHGH
jgi:copper(I)-binding protein